MSQAIPYTTGSLTVTGEDLTKVMDMQDWSGLPFPAMPIEARVALLCAKYAAFGLIPLVAPRWMQQMAHSLHPLLDPLVMAVSFYALAEQVARARGQDPDRPSRLKKVTETV